jgi:hypothetical protein
MTPLPWMSLSRSAAWDTEKNNVKVERSDDSRQPFALDWLGILLRPQAAAEIDTPRCMNAA